MTAPATAAYGVQPRNSDKRTPVEYMLVTDQHGRDWEGEFDLRTLTWIGSLHPKNWESPVDIPPKYIMPVRGSNGRNVAGKVEIRYKAWLKDLADRALEWRQDLTSRARAMYPNSYGEQITNPTRDLLVEVGPGPIDYRLVEAMAAGNKWALGKTKARPSWVTDDMIEGVAVLKRSSGWREQARAVGEIDPSLYPDAEDEMEGIVAEDAAPEKRGPGRPRKGA